MKSITHIILVFVGICTLGLLQNPIYSQNGRILDPGYYIGEPLEEVKFHTDRDLYLAGESVWFSSFCGIKNEFSASPVSKILYVEIYNAAHKVFLRKKFRLKDGKASGHLIIPEETPTGYYFIRAYTMYLRNFPPENYFISSLTIINPEIKQSSSYGNKDIKIATENGRFTNDTSLQLALKIPHVLVQKTISASLENNNGEQLDQLKMYPNGLCNIEYTPVDSIQYFLKLKYQDGDSLLTSLPGSHKRGVSIQTKISESELRIKTYWTEYDQKSFSNCKLKILTQAYHSEYETAVTLKLKVTEFKVPLTELSSGLSYIILADQNDSILSFKPVYIESEAPANIQINLSKNTFKARDKVELDIQFPPNDFELMTLAVVKKGTAISGENILSEIVIENPFLLKSYFEKTPGISVELMEQINIALMLYAPNALESYRKRIDQQKPEWIYPPEIRDVSVSGFLLDKKTKEPIKDVQIFASVLFEDFQLHTTRTLEDGSFVFTLNHLTGKHNLYLFPDIHERGEHELLIHNDFSTDFRDLNKCMPFIDSTFLNLLEEIYVNQQVSNNFPGGISAEEQEVPKLSPWFGVEMISIKLADYINLTSFREVINEIVPSVRLKENNNQYRFTVFDEKAQAVYENPLVLLDHIPVTDISELIKIHPAMIEKIEVMNQPYILGDYTIWGLILITTKTDNFASIKLPEESAFLNYQTLQNSSSFIPLDFGSELNESSSLPFFSTVLYWDPSFNNASNTEKTSFYTSDHMSEFEILIKGINSNGDFYKGVETFSVRDK